MFVYLMSAETTRIRLVPRFMGAAVRYALADGEVWTNQAVSAVALWLPPGKTSQTIGGMLRARMLHVPLTFGWSGLRRFIPLAGYTDRLHRRVAPPMHWYLWIMGVDPPAQGRGIGRALLEPVLVRADQTSVVCYLDSFNPRSLPFYERLGFVVAEEGRLPKAALALWAMTRQPRG
jgi:ribosomal protein S18 acetylase RimI-like enzyme